MTIKEFSDFLKKQLGGKTVTYNDIKIDDNGVAWIKFDIYDDNFFKINEIFIDTTGKYKITKIE